MRTSLKLALAPVVVDILKRPNILAASPAPIILFSFLIPFPPIMSTIVGRSTTDGPFACGSCGFWRLLQIIIDVCGSWRVPSPELQQKKIVRNMQTQERTACLFYGMMN